MSEELAPCPFCGKEDAEVESVLSTSPKYVVCLNCAAEGPVEQEDGAVAAWNRRTPSELDRLKDAVVEWVQMLPLDALIYALRRKDERAWAVEFEHLKMRVSAYESSQEKKP